MAERLVVLSPEHAPTAQGEIQARHRVLGTLPPRLLIVELDDDQATALLREATAESVLSRPSDPIPASLNEAERLFVEAWRQRHGPPKQRPGEGLNWDAEGFRPPDRPPQR